MQFCGWWGLPLLTEWKLKLAGSLKFLCFPSPGGFGHKNINCLSVQCVCLFFLDIQTYRHCPTLDIEIRTLFQCRMRNAECRMHNWFPRLMFLCPVSMQNAQCTMQNGLFA